MGHEVEIVVPTLREPGVASEIINGDGLDPGLGEAPGQRAVVRVQSAGIGQDDNAATVGTHRAGQPGREPGAIRRRQDQVVLRRDFAVEPMPGWLRVDSVTHGVDYPETALGASAAAPRQSPRSRP